MRSETRSEEWGVEVVIFFKSGREKERRQFLFSRFESEVECRSAAAEFDRSAFLKKWAGAAKRRSK